MNDAAYTAADREAMAQALALAHEAVGLSDPNPRVGCVLIGAHGERASGHTQAAGQAHAEVMALRAAQAAGWDVRGATAYVTLEPCAHHGRTPPCCDALAAAGIARVVVALGDPNPQVAGQGLQRMRAAGIQVELGLMADEARALNIGFLSRMQRGRPWVRMKIAASLDGRTALDDGRSQWITGTEARADGHAWRRRAGAVLTGSGTVRDDDPRLDVRLVPTVHQPVRVLVDSTLQTALNARLLARPGQALVYAARPTPERLADWRAHDHDPVVLAGPDGRVDLRALLADLALRGINELHVEAGQTLNGALLRAGLVDELLVYLAPKLIGPGRGMVAIDALTGLDGAPAFKFTDVCTVGSDLRLLARPRDNGVF